MLSRPIAKIRRNKNVPKNSKHWTINSCGILKFIKLQNFILKLQSDKSLIFDQMKAIKFKRNVKIFVIFKVFHLIIWSIILCSYCYFIVAKSNINLDNWCTVKTRRKGEVLMPLFCLKAYRTKGLLKNHIKLKEK